MELLYTCSNPVTRGLLARCLWAEPILGLTAPLPHSLSRTFPIRGFQIYDGPVRLTRSTFRNYVPTADRFTSAVGFNLKNTWQLTPRNNLSSISFEPSVSSVPLPGTAPNNSYHLSCIQKLVPPHL